MKWYSNLSKKARQALLIVAWVLAVAVIIIIVSIANGETLPWWATLIMFLAILPAITFTVLEIQNRTPKTAQQNEQPTVAASGTESNKPLDGLTFCLTGDYNWEHKDIYSLIIECGGIIEKQPHKYLNFMIDDEGEDSFYSKTITAARLKRNGSRVQIISLCALFIYLSNYIDVDAWLAARSGLDREYYTPFSECYSNGYTDFEKEAKRIPQLIAKAEKINSGAKAV